MPETHQWTPLIIAHTVFAIAALLLGAVLLVKHKGTLNHRIFGWIWVSLMSLVALVSFGIRRDGYSWIHLLSIFALVMLIVGVRHAKRHQAMHHGKTMKGIYFWALVATGLFTLLPSRLIGQALFM